MKVTPRDVAKHLKSLDKNIRAVLIYGGDEGLVRERADRIAEQVIPDKNDPFLYSSYMAKQLKADPFRLVDEVQQLPLTGQSRLIYVEQGEDFLTPAIEEALSLPSIPNFLLLTANALKASSKLRKLFETDKRSLAIACYSDEIQTLDALIRQIVEAQGYKIETDARQYLIQNLGANRALTRNELEKLVLYKGTDKAITLKDVVSAIGDNGRLSLDMVVNASLNGQSVICDLEYMRAIDSGTTPIAILRMIMQRIEQLYQASLARDEGVPVTKAIESLRPPIFWKDKKSFETQLRRWSTKKLLRALDLSVQAECECKSNDIPAEESCGRFLLRLAAAAQRN